MEDYPQPSGQHYDDDLGHGDDAGHDKDAGHHDDAGHEYSSPSTQPPQQLAAKVTPMQSVDPTSNTTGSSIHSSGYPSYLAEKVDPRVLELLYWRNPVKSGVVLGLLLLIEFSLVFCSVISVAAYTAIFFLAFAAFIRLYVNLFKKADVPHPFQDYLDADYTISRDDTANVTTRILDRVNGCVLKLRDLFLVSNYVESCKMAVFLYLMTYVGARFNFLTLCILVTIGAFSLLKLYDTYQDQFDQIFEVAKKKALEAWAQIRAKLDTLPVIGKKDKPKSN